MVKTTISIHKLNNEKIMELNEINEMAWKLAEAAMIKERSRNKSFSNSRIRKMLEALKKDDFEAKIKELSENYQPQGQDKEKGNADRKKEVCKNFGEESISVAKSINKEDIMPLMQYVQWNVSILEKSPDKIDFMKKCERGEKCRILINETTKKIQNTKLFVGNLDYSATNNEIKELFSKYGEVKNVEIKEGRGFRFVEMSIPEDAQKAKEALNRCNFKGRVLIVDDARPPENIKKFKKIRNKY